MQSLDSGMLLLSTSRSARMVIIGQVLMSPSFDVLSAALRRQLMATDRYLEALVELRDIREAFGGVHAVDGSSASTCTPVKSSRCSVTTPASRR
jgi:hypothetical protein